MRSANPGIVYALLAYGTWGLSPLYWHLLAGVSSLEILCHRFVWSSVLLLGFLIGTRRWPELVKLLHQPQKVMLLLTTASLLAFNWGLYIYGVNNGRVIETSLGYFINPLVNIVLGVLILREQLHWGQWLAVGLAAAGVSYATLAVGQVPWIALSLAFSFGLYGLLRKLVNLPSLIGLTLESSLLTPLILVYLALQPVHHFGKTPTITLLLMGAGIVTALPLFWFGHAAPQLPLSTLGFFQYLAPSLALILGIWFFHEPFTHNHLITFCLIWTALLLYTGVTVWRSRVNPVPD